MGLVAAIALLVGLGLYEALRRVPSDSPADAAAEAVVTGLCAAISMTYQVGIVRSGEDDVVTGDPAFDRQFRVRGPEDVVRAVFDAETRRKLAALTTVPFELQELALEDGVLNAVATLRLDAGERARLKRRLGNVAKALRDPGRVAQHLARAWRHEGHRDARRLQLATLARHHATHADTIAAAREAVKDGDPELRFVAAAALGTEGRAALRRLALDDRVDAALAARAIGALGAEFIAADAAARLEPLLDEPMTLEARLPIALACLSALGRTASVDAVAMLQDLAERHGHPLRRAAREAVAAIQARATGARGGVSLAPDGSGAGQVSLAAEPGTVSLRPGAKPPRA